MFRIFARYKNIVAGKMKCGATTPKEKNVGEQLFGAAASPSNNVEEQFLCEGFVPCTKHVLWGAPLSHKNNVNELLHFEQLRACVMNIVTIIYYELRTIVSACFAHVVLCNLQYFAYITFLCTLTRTGTHPPWKNKFSVVHSDRATRITRNFEIVTVVNKYRQVFQEFL